MSADGVCNCRAYTFPHRYMSGRCDGWEAVDKVIDGQHCPPDCPYLGHTDNNMVVCNLSRPYTPRECPGLKDVLK